MVPKWVVVGVAVHGAAGGGKERQWKVLESLPLFPLLQYTYCEPQLRTCNVNLLALIY
jgi:hypothetical protein